MKKVGLLMGCFNPIHNSHIALAESVLNQGIVDEVEIIPARDNLNEKDVKITCAEDRIQMIELALEGKKNIRINRIEVDFERQLYTYESLEMLKKGRELYLIIGSDNLRSLDSWRNPEEILRKYKIIVPPRDNDNVLEVIENNPNLKKYKQNIIVIDKVKGVSASSTLIRNNIKNKESIKDLLPEAVIKYITEKKLYQ